jgi:hypothetical protein
MKRNEEAGRLEKQKERWNEQQKKEGGGIKSIGI